MLQQTLPSPVARVSVLPGVVGRVSGILYNHDHLKKTMRHLDVMCEQLERGAHVPQKPVGPAELLANLQRHLSEHFAAEESQDYFGAMLAQTPGLSRVISILSAEHLSMLRTVSALQEMAQDPTRWSHLATPVRRLIKDFELHELAETKLLHELFRAPAVAT